ncbi:hypothetical protein NC653_007123 [Populus alba x Populus x berolinensis]|uniref:Uncharacterized protein n=3 Tax=Populus TaxID=3689 RepID=A0A4U5P5H9_POPAL|nr:hypothetical protein NC653_007123 [Populus alba x Populus x berolinensis]TKR90951.1 hypothetical protein D5086_0000228260 [Populus alba]
MDLFSDWPDGVSGSLTVHLQNLHITIASVDFSADIDDVSFFEGLSAWMFHLLGFCLSGLLSLSTDLLLMKCVLGLWVVMLAFLLAYVLQYWSFFGNVWSPTTKNFFACLGKALSPNVWPPLCWHGDLVYQICALLAMYVILSQGCLYLLPSYCFAGALFV